MRQIAIAGANWVVLIPYRAYAGEIWCIYNKIMVWPREFRGPVYN